MANWTPSEEHRDKLKTTVNTLMMRRVAIMEMEFPLTLEQVKLVTTPPQLADLLELGLDSLATTSTLSFEVGPEQGAQRQSIVKTYLLIPTYYAYSRQRVGSFIKGKPIYFNPGLDPDIHARLITWVDRAVYERRLAMLVRLTVADFLHHTPEITIYHIAQRWPVLTTIFPRVSESYGSHQRHRDIWESHGKQLGRNLSRWKWPLRGQEAEWYNANHKKLRVCEEAILSALTLPEAHAPTLPVRAEISDWDKLGRQV